MKSINAIAGFLKKNQREFEELMEMVSKNENGFDTPFLYTLYLSYSIQKKPSSQALDRTRSLEKAG